MLKYQHLPAILQKCIMCQRNIFKIRFSGYQNGIGTTTTPYCSACFCVIPLLLSVITAIFPMLFPCLSHLLVSQSCVLIIAYRISVGNTIFPVQLSITYPDCHNLHFLHPDNALKSGAKNRFSQQIVPVNTDRDQQIITIDLQEHDLLSGVLIDTLVQLMIVPITI